VENTKIILKYRLKLFVELDVARGQEMTRGGYVDLPSCLVGWETDEYALYSSLYNVARVQSLAVNRLSLIDFDKHWRSKYSILSHLGKLSIVLLEGCARLDHIPFLTRNSLDR
jgi:hypothetical protein